MPLVIVHREASSAPIAPGIPMWRTCLREVQFLGDDEVTTDQGGQRLVEGDAYRLLLEILCGLQSPMVGETQVMGQFKVFLASLGREDAWLNRVGQRLLADARDLRTKHLRGLGSRSYGSAIRRDLVDCAQVALIGTGKLAQEVLPFLADNGRRVDQWRRSDLDDSATHPVSSTPAALIVAAPAPPEVIEQVAERYQGLRRVIDLRAELGARPLRVSAPIITLQDLFDRVRATHTSAAPQLEAARAGIALCSRRYELRDELRPFGWDDLCA